MLVSARLNISITKYTTSETMRIAMSERVREMENLLAAQKLGRLIQKLLPDFADPLDFHQLRDGAGALFPTPEAADEAVSATMRDWMGVPQSLNSIADIIESEPTCWHALLDGSYVPTTNPIPAPIQNAIARAMQAKPLRPGIREELHSAMNAPLSFVEFEHCRLHLASGKSPGPSGLTTTQMKHWSPETSKVVFDLSSIMWWYHHVPQWWQDRLMTLLPKEPGVHDLTKIRPISLFEIIRKFWAGMITTRVQQILQSSPAWF